MLCRINRTVSAIAEVKRKMRLRGGEKRRNPLLPASGEVTFSPEANSIAATDQRLQAPSTTESSCLSQVFEI